MEYYINMIGPACLICLIGQILLCQFYCFVDKKHFASYQLLVKIQNYSFLRVSEFFVERNNKKQL